MEIFFILKSVYFPPGFLEVWLANKNLSVFNVHNVVFCYKYILCVMITMIRLINIFITSYSYHFVCVWKEHWRFTLRKFQVYNILLLTIVTMLYIRSLELIHFITESYSLSLTSPHFSHPLVPGNHCPTLYFFKFDFFRFHKISDIVLYLSFCIWLNSFSIMSSKFIPDITNGRISFFLKAK